MNRTGRWCCCWPQRRRSMYLLLLTTTLLALAACEEQQRPGTKALDPGVTGVRAFFDDILGAGSSGHGNAVSRQARTFGHKRIQFMMMPMIYKMGVMMTMLTVLTIISLKGLMIGVALLVLKLSAIFGKLYASHHHSYGHASAGWTPPQPVHVHVHNSGGYEHHGQVYEPHGQAYSGWESAASGPPDDHYYYKG